MKNGFWKTVRKAPVLLMAFAVCPAAMADGWSVDGSADAKSANQPAAAADSNSSRPIQLISMDAPPCAPVAQPCSPLAACAPSSCECGPCGGCTFQWAPDRWCNIGAGIRTSFNSLAGPTINGKNPVDDRNFFAVDEARLFFTGKITQVIGFELNTDISGAGGTGFGAGIPDSIHLLDAIAKFEFNDYVNFWMGRMLPPNDRADLSGPFFQNGWDYPFVSNFPGKFEGRDDGIAYWGQYGGGQFKWQFGLYNGQGRFGAGNDWATSASGPNGNGDPEFVMRVVANLLDPEPGYYNASTYYGEKNIAAIGFSLTDQQDALTDTNGHVGTFFGYNVDFLFENKMTEYGSGCLEGAYYHYSVGGDVANGVAGNAGYVFAGWLLPQECGCCGFCGRFRPYARYQRYDYSDSTFTANVNNGFFAKDEWDLGAQFVIKGHNARFDTFYGQRELESGGHEDIFRTGFQLIF